MLDLWKRVTLHAILQTQLISHRFSAVLQKGWRTMQVVMKDVAKYAGLSVSVVSKYLKSPESVRCDTREKIEAAISALGYVPNLNARSLRTGRTNLISVITPEVTDPLYIAFFDELRQVMRPLGISMLLQTVEDTPDVSRGGHFLSAAQLQPVDAVILCFPDDEKLVEETAARSGCPVVLIHWRPHPAAAINIVVDVAEGMYLATRYLLEQGHTRLAYIGGPDWSCQSTRKREGFLRAVREAGCLQTCENIFRGAYRMDTGTFGMDVFSKLRTQPTAVVTENDQLAVGALQYHTSYPSRLPEDLAFTGFGDTFLTMVIFPQIASIHIPLPKICSFIAERLTAYWKTKEGATCHYEPTLSIKDPNHRIEPNFSPRTED